MGVTRDKGGVITVNAKPTLDEHGVWHLPCPFGCPWEVQGSLADYCAQRLLRHMNEDHRPQRGQA